MENNSVRNYIKNVLKNQPEGWLNSTTHRLDIYDESLAKTAFLDEFEKLYQKDDFEKKSLDKLPTAYDYIRLGHPLSCFLEWSLAKSHTIASENVIVFSSQTTPILAVLRKNKLENKRTQLIYKDSLPACFDANLIKKVYGYQFDTIDSKDYQSASEFNGTKIMISKESNIATFEMKSQIDFYLTTFDNIGSILYVNGSKNNDYISEIQHVRRRETIAMTPSNCIKALDSFVNENNLKEEKSARLTDKANVLQSIQEITNIKTKPLVGSSGLSIQYAIMMGLIDNALENYKDKKIKFIVPPNCYGGTNDQARRIAACLENVEIVDLLVDGDNDMVKSIDKVLDTIAEENAIPYIIAEIPTNPRVEVPNLEDLRTVLSKTRKTKSGEIAIEPVFILDQTFCPNFHFLGEGNILDNIKTLSYASGSKFPSGGKCTAGYVVGSEKTISLLEKIETHLCLCDNEATTLQYEILAMQLPSMNKRIEAAYKNTHNFVQYIKQVLPAAKINFVSDELATQGFTPSVFSLDLPTKGNTAEEKEMHKRELNLKLITKMITEIPTESKFCVSYGQLKGCYWTIPATSTQGTTKEGDKDYIVRVALSGDMDLELHKKVFQDFVDSI